MENKKCRVSPSLIRAFMPPLRDDEEELYRYHQEKCYRDIEMAARTKKWFIIYSLGLADSQEQFTVENGPVLSGTLDDQLLDAVFFRLIRWLERPAPGQDQGFFVSIEGRTSRTIRVSWDPVLTPGSVADDELSNTASNAYRRLRWARRCKTSTSLNDSVGRDQDASSLSVDEKAQRQLLEKCWKRMNTQGTSSSTSTREENAGSPSLSQEEE
jgi:hypothetical protein